MTPARLRPLAEADLIERTRYYRTHGGAVVAETFVDAAVEALRAIERMPGAGSPRIGELCGVAGLRARPVSTFGCGWYYLLRSDHVDVVRLLADRQDLAALLDAMDE